ncbi:MAG TPA: hypothetical protein VGC41_10090 [Kofleriaceae bacterium]
MSALLAFLLTACAMTRPTHDQAATFARTITAETRIADVDAAWGKPARDIGSGIHIYVYPLADDGELRVGSSDGRTVMYVVLSDAAGARKLYGR